MGTSEKVSSTFVCSQHVFVRAYISNVYMHSLAFQSLYQLSFGIGRILRREDAETGKRWFCRDEGIDDVDAGHAGRSEDENARHGCGQETGESWSSCCYTASYYRFTNMSCGDSSCTRK